MRCALRTFSLVTPLSLSVKPGQHLSFLPVYMPYFPPRITTQKGAIIGRTRGVVALGRSQNVPQRQDQRRLALVHARLETALVERLAEGAHAAARAAPGYQAGSAL